MITSKTGTLKEDTTERALQQYCPSIRVTDSKLTRSKRTIFYKTEEPTKTFNTIYKHKEEIRKAVGQDIDIQPFSTTPPTRSTATSPEEETHCVATNVPVDYTEEEIRHRIDPDTLAQISRIARIKSGPQGRPTTYVRIICKDKDTAATLIRQGLLLGIRRFTCEPPRHQPRILQCYQCQRFGHHSSECTYKDPVCGKCARHHKTIGCPHTNDRSEHYCANCRERHPAYAKSCPAYQEAFQRAKAKDQEAMRRQRQEVAKSATPYGMTAWSNIVKSTQDANTRTQQQIHEDITKQTDTIKTETGRQLDQIKIEIKMQISGMLSKLHKEVQEMINDLYKTMKEDAKKILEEARQEMKRQLTETLKENIPVMTKEMSAALVTQMRSSRETSTHRPTSQPPARPRGRSPNKR